MYKADTSAEVNAWDGAFAVLGIRIISTDVFLGWFNLAEACSAFLWEQEFDAIVEELEYVVRILDKGLIICKMFNELSFF